MDPGDEEVKHSKERAADVTVGLITVGQQEKSVRSL